MVEAIQVLYCTLSYTLRLRTASLDFSFSRREPIFSDRC